MIGSFTSPLTLEGGTLEVTKTLSLQNPIVVKKNSIVNVPEGVVLTTTGNISGSGVIHKTGGGLWNQYDECSNRVGIHIDEGILHAHKTLPLKNVKVRHKTIFQGSAITRGDFINEGLLRLGSMGSLIIHRNYIQTPKGSLHLQVGLNGIYDALRIQGRASLDGALHLDFDTDGYDFPHSYTLITASSLVGFFTQITSNKPGIGIIDFETNQVTFTLIAPDVILPNQMSLGSLLPKIDDSSALTESQTIYYLTSFPNP